MVHELNARLVEELFAKKLAPEGYVIAIVASRPVYRRDPAFPDSKMDAAYRARLAQWQTPPGYEFMLEQTVQDRETVYRPHFVNRRRELTGERVKDARVDFREMGQPTIKLTLDAIGAKKFSQVTSDYAPGGARNPNPNTYRELAFVLDGRLCSAPVIVEAIYGGNLEISGNFTFEEATLLANALRAGALPAPITVTEQRPAEPSQGVATFQAPALILDGRLIVASGEGQVYSLNSATGALQWQYSSASVLRGAPNWLRDQETGRNSVFVIAQEDGALHCLNSLTGQLLWKSESTERSDGTIAVGAHAIVFGNCGAALYFFSPRDGANLGNLPLGDDCQVAAGVALTADGRVFAGTRSGKVFCADSARRELVWTSTNATAEVFTTPAVGDDRVVVASADDNVYCLRRDNGALVWKTPVKSGAKSPVIVGTRVVVSAGGSLYVLALDTGATVWSRDVGDGITSPAIVSGMIVVGNDDGSVHAFGSTARKAE
jgi:outer membrane protein assembly factor BamB